MRQVLQQARTGEITVEEVPAPQLLPGCVLVRVAASVVSAGTERASSEFAKKNLFQKARSRPDLVRDVISNARRDGIASALHAVRSRLDQPQTHGYSSAGTVIAVGQGVTDLRPGDRVACAGAGFAVHAEVACVPRLLAARIPLRDHGARDEVAFEEAAFATLGAVALHGIRTAEAKLGEMIAVIGLGLLGQLTVQILKAAGCRVIGMDLNASRSVLARQMGADAAVVGGAELRQTCLEVSRGMGADAVLITAETPSSDPVNLAGEIARDRGIVVAVGTVGIDIERKAYYEKELDFRVSRSYGPGRYDAVYEQKGRDYPIGYVRWTENRNMETFLQLLAEKKVNVCSLTTHRFPIERAQSAYELIGLNSQESSLGVVITYSSSGEALSSVTLGASSEVKRVADSPRNGLAVGVLGAGVFSVGTLIPALAASRRATLVGVCAANGAHAQSAASKFKFQYCSTDEGELIRDANIDTVVIATRHHLHARQVMAALAERKHVFCEKPLCVNQEELKAIARSYLRLSPIGRPQLMVGFNRRFAPMITQMKCFLRPVVEPLALHYRINAGHLPADHWVNDPEQGGGRIVGELCHFVDLLTFLSGSPIVEVDARSLSDDGRYSGDNVLLSIAFASGSQGSISYLANGDRSFSKERIEVFGGGAAATLDDFRRLDLVRDGRKETVRSRWHQDKGHHAEWAAFAAAVEGKTESAIAFEELVCSTLATFGVAESLATGKRVPVNTNAFLASSSKDVDTISHLTE